MSSDSIDMGGILEIIMLGCQAITFDIESLYKFIKSFDKMSRKITLINIGIRYYVISQFELNSKAYRIFTV